MTDTLESLDRSYMQFCESIAHICNTDVWQDKIGATTPGRACQKAHDMVLLGHFVSLLETKQQFQGQLRPTEKAKDIPKVCLISL